MYKDFMGIKDNIDRYLEEQAKIHAPELLI